MRRTRLATPLPRPRPRRRRRRRRRRSFAASSRTKRSPPPARVPGTTPRAVGSCPPPPRSDEGHSIQKYVVHRSSVEKGIDQTLKLGDG
eukprot:31013-Pelagococcus_subviridis.AAC.7